MRCDQYEVSQVRRNRSDQHLYVLSLFFRYTLTDTVIVDDDALGLAFRFFGLILPELWRRATVQYLVVDNVVFLSTRRTVDDKDFVEWCRSRTDLETRTTLAPVWWRSEQYNAIRSHREVVRLLWVTDELLLILCVDGHGAARIAFVWSLLRWHRPLQGARKKCEPFTTASLRQYSVVGSPAW
jgi:hypothetical protein